MDRIVLFLLRTAYGILITVYSLPMFNKRTKKAVKIAWTVVGILVMISMVLLYIPALVRP